MATAQDAELILKLYELRTEETMRKARHFVIMEFFPSSPEDVQALFANRSMSLVIDMRSSQHLPGRFAW